MAWRAGLSPRRRVVLHQRRAAHHQAKNVWSLRCLPKLLISLRNKQCSGVCPSGQDAVSMAKPSPIMSRRIPSIDKGQNMAFV